MSPIRTIMSSSGLWSTGARRLGLAIAFTHVVSFVIEIALPMRLSRGMITAFACGSIGPVRHVLAGAALVREPGSRMTQSWCSQLGWRIAPPEHTPPLHNDQMAVKAPLPMQYVVEAPLRLQRSLFLGQDICNACKSLLERCAWAVSM